MTPYGKILPPNLSPSSDPAGLAIAAAYEEDLARQLTEHGLGVPAMNLFPLRKNGSNGKHLRYGEGFVTGHCYEESFDSILLDPVSPQDVAAQQVFTGLHELAHHIDEISGLVEKIRETQNTYPLGDLEPFYSAGFNALSEFNTDQNNKERLADGAACLYMMSNYEGDISRMLQGAINHRMGYVDLEHDTVSTFKGLREHYGETLPRGLDIVQCVDRAVEYMAGQDLKVEQLMTLCAQGLLYRNIHKTDPNRHYSSLLDMMFAANLSDAVEKQLDAWHEPFRNGPLPRGRGTFRHMMAGPVAQI